MQRQSKFPQSESVSRRRSRGARTVLPLAEVARRFAQFRSQRSTLVDGPLIRLVDGHHRGRIEVRSPRWWNASQKSEPRVSFRSQAYCR
jgi:hypothetical protein